MRELPGEAAGDESGVALSETERGAENCALPVGVEPENLITGTGSQVARQYQSVVNFDSRRLLEELQVSLEMTVAALSRMAAIIKRLDELGELQTASEMLGAKIVASLLDIANGSLHPEVYLRFGHRTDLLNRVRSLPEPEQRKIVDAETLPLVRVRGPNRCVQRVRPELIGSSQARQLIGENGVRSVEEQIQYLTPEQIEKPKVKVDYSRLGITVNGAFVGVDDLEDYVGKLRGVKYQFKGLPQFKDDPEFAGKTESEIAEILAPDIPNLLAYFKKKGKLQGRWTLEDLSPVATMAMLKAIRTFNPDKGTQFRSTYLTTILLRDCWQHMAAVDVHPNAEAECRRARVLSLSLPVGKDGSRTLMDSVAKKGTNDEVAVEGVDDDEKDVVWGEVGGIKQREAELIKLRYQEGKTQEEIGDLWGVSRARIHQIESRALNRLRSNSKLASLAGAVPGDESDG